MRSAYRLRQGPAIQPTQTLARRQDAGNKTMTETEYQKNELDRHYREMSRKEGYFDGVADFAETLDSADWMQEQLEWIENGSYGAGACFALQMVMRHMTGRHNKTAHVGRFLLSCLNGCEFNAWRKLDKATQERVNTAVNQWLAETHEFAATLKV